MAGLRERKKTDTRRALSDAAMRLSAERGLENVTREDIAALAGVSARTFSNYFATKYDALVYRQTERVHRGVALLRRRPAGEALWTSITEALVGPIEEDFAQETGDKHTLPTPAGLVEIRKLLANSEVRSALTRDLEGGFASAIAERTGTDPQRDMYPRLVAAVIRAVVETTMDIYATADPPVAYPTLLRAALTDVGAGLPAPNDKSSVPNLVEG
ncbi:TetR/AcrR family transcriptional regulator [Mycobacterium sp. pUA109]|uniref:TetR/AcrR family transcriptional regulator n=1 Tax=Mycobacterium sp. pUA109 TaxID=3238982 RepID=UPI00351AB1BA